jgi:hypothetical protein
MDLVLCPAKSYSVAMPLDAQTQIDHTLLDMIEHSPVGAVPHTPAYQDALSRLRAAHQVYADADHKDGFVTARSLASRPPFHAANLEAFATGQIDAAALEPNAAIFDRYLQVLPPALRAKAESCRATVAGKPIHHRKHAGSAAPHVFHDPVHTLLLVPGAGIHPGLPGNYLYGYILEVTGKGIPPTWSVHLHDSDDGAAVFDGGTLAEAYARVQDVLASAPFHMNELEALGFRPN